MPYSHRGGDCIALTILSHGVNLCETDDQIHTLAALNQGKSLGTRSTGGGVNFRACVGGYLKIKIYFPRPRGFEPWKFSP